MKPSPGVIAGAIVVGSFLAAAILFRTHGFEVTPLGWEMVRHFGLFFVVGELAVVALGFRAGLNVAAGWQGLARADRIALCVWLAFFSVGSLLSEQPAYSIVAVSSWPVHLMFGLSIRHFAGQARFSIEQSNHWIGSGIAVVLIALLIMTTVHFVQHVDPRTLPGGKVFWAGAIPGFMSVRMFGAVMGYVALFGTGMILAGDMSCRRGLSGILVLLGFGALCWSSTRAAVPAFLAALLFVPLVARCRPDRGAWLLVGVLVVAAGLVSVLIPAPSPEFGTLNLFDLGAVTPEGRDVTAGRLEIWRAVIAAIGEQPLLGHGEGATRWLLGPEPSVHVQPHNVLLQLVLHWGAVAAFAAIWLAGRALRAMIAAVRREHALLPYAMVVVAACTAALFDGVLYYPQMVMVPVAALAVTLARRSTGDPSRIGVVATFERHLPQACDI